MSALVLCAVACAVAAPPRFPFDDFASHGYDAVLGSPFAASDPGWRPSRVSVHVREWTHTTSAPKRIAGLQRWPGSGRGGGGGECHATLSPRVCHRLSTI